MKRAVVELIKKFDEMTAVEIQQVANKSIERLDTMGFSIESKEEPGKVLKSISYSAADHKMYFTQKEKGVK